MIQKIITKMYLLVMPKYFTHGRFPEVGQKQKTERKEREKRPNDGNKNGQATHGARKPPGPISV